jgi:PIN domain nuclease of toxin-antitoxin system
MGIMKYLLDTCTFLWLGQEPDKISPIALRIINDADSQLYLSDISIWEITLKYASGRLAMPAEPHIWIPNKIKYHQLLSVALNHAVIYRSGDLPKVHMDPFDRLISAQAITLGAVILSPDLLLTNLGAARIW